MTPTQTVPPTPNWVVDFLTTLKSEFQPTRLLASVVAGTMTGMIGVIRAISYAALIFSGGLAIHLNVGVGIAIFSSAAISLTVALSSSLPGMIATPLAAPTAVLAVLAAGIDATLVNQVDSQTILITVIAAIALGSLLTGASLWLLGTLKLGKLLDVIPYPVIGGFMAGTGWLLVRGALTVMTGRSLTLLNLTWFCQAAVSVHWLAGLAIALLLLGIGKRWRHPLVLPGTLLAATAVFFCVLWLSGLPLATARAQGWLLGPFPQGQLWQPLSFSDYSQIHWGAIAHQGGTLGLLVLVSFLSLVLTNNGIELALERDLDLNRELQAVGIANFVAGCGSSMAGNQALPSTILVHKMGAANRLSGCLKAVPCCVVLALGPTFLAYFPRPILGSLLLFLGLELLWQWLVKGWHKFSRFDYCTVLATLLAIACSGLMSGIAIGLSLSVLQFLYRSARLPIIATTVQDPDPGGAELLSVGSKLEVIPLQGALFFGNAAHLFEQLHVKITTPTQIALTQVAPTHCAEESAPKQYLLLDLTNVLDIDASARLALNKLLSLAQHHQTMILYVGLAESLKQPSTFHEDLCASSSYCQVFDTVEQAQTWLHSHATTITASVSQTTEAAVLRHPSQVIG